MTIDYIELIAVGIGLLSFVSYLLNDKDEIKPKKQESISLDQIIKRISKASEDEIETILEECATKLLIPNWYTKTDIEVITRKKITDRQWDDILLNKSNDILTETNTLVTNFFTRETEIKLGVRCSNKNS